MTSLDRIIVLCAYCKKLISIKDGQGVRGTSTGICRPCLDLAKGVVHGWLDHTSRNQTQPTAMEKLRKIPAGSLC